MKKTIALSILPAALFLGACTTHLAVDSAAHPIATYSSFNGIFDGTLDGDVKSVFKATNTALEQDLKYFRVGQKQTQNGWIVFARAELDHEIVVTITKGKEGNEVIVSIEYGDGDLLKSQQIFNSIAKAHRSFAR